VLSKAALLISFPSLSVSFSLSTSLVPKPTSGRILSTFNPIAPIPLTSRTAALHASDEGDLASSEDDSSWSPFDDGVDRAPRSKPPQEKPDDSSWSPFDDGIERIPRSKPLQQMSESKTLQQMSESFTSEPIPVQPTDSLIASLTRVDPEIAKQPTRVIPIFGEIPVDGTLLLLVPVTLIAVLGVILTFYIGYTSRDVIATELEAVTNAMSKPVSKETVVQSGCRGICSDQAGQLEYMRGFMESLKKVD